MRRIDYTLKQSKHLISTLQNVASQLQTQCRHIFMIQDAVYISRIEPMFRWRQLQQNARRHIQKTAAFTVNTIRSSKLCSVSKWCDCRSIPSSLPAPHVFLTTYVTYEISDSHSSVDED